MKHSEDYPVSTKEPGTHTPLLRSSRGVDDGATGVGMGHPECGVSVPIP